MIPGQLKENINYDMELLDPFELERIKLKQFKQDRFKIDRLEEKIID